TSMSCLPRPPAVSARLTSSVVSALRSPAAFGDPSCDSERPRSASPYPTHVRSQHDQDRSMTPLTESDIHARVARLADLRAAIATAIVGQHEVVEQLLTGLLAGGHCLLEGVPGLGKTLLVSSGPARPPPKTRAALPGARRGNAASSAARTPAPPEPFCVPATRTRSEQAGTYPLPEAHLDRFLLHTALDSPDEEEGRAIT